jgi:hypothetical protein
MVIGRLVEYYLGATPRIGRSPLFDSGSETWLLPDTVTESLRWTLHASFRRSTFPTASIGIASKHAPHSNFHRDICKSACNP